MNIWVQPEIPPICTLTGRDWQIRWSRLLKAAAPRYGRWSTWRRTTNCYTSISHRVSHRFKRSKCERCWIWIVSSCAWLRRTTQSHVTWWATQWESRSRYLRTRRQGSTWWRSSPGTKRQSLSSSTWLRTMRSIRLTPPSNLTTCITIM